MSRSDGWGGAPVRLVTGATFCGIRGSAKHAKPSPQGPSTTVYAAGQPVQITGLFRSALCACDALLAVPDQVAAARGVCVAVRGLHG